LSKREAITEPRSIPGRRLPRILAYVVAVLVVLGAGAARYELNPIWGSKLPYITFFPAVAAAAWFGDLGPGLVATALSAMCALAFLPPVGRLRVDDGYDLIGLALFTAVAVFIVVLTEAQHRAAGEPSWWGMRPRRRRRGSAA
jgi:two-component system, sensor histidine kinase and response regulator